MAEWACYSLPDTEWTQAVASAGGIPPLFKDTETSVDIPARRDEVNILVRKSVEAADKSTLDGIRVEERRVPVDKPEGLIAIRIYTPDPQHLDETFPVLVDFHGSGFCMGDIDTDELLCRAVCRKHRIVVVNVDYRLAPEFPWPVGIDDSYGALKWVVQHADEIRVDLAKGFVVSGNSAGATLVCVITQRACRGDDLDLRGRITGQILQIPLTCVPGADGYPVRYRDKLRSYKQNASDPVLSRRILGLFLDAYKAGPETRDDVSPLLAESFAGLPAAVVQVAGADSLRDDGLCYAQRLEEDGVPVKLEIYPGVPHAFYAYFPQLNVSQRWRDDFDQGLQWLLLQSALERASV